jgi:hypothetical protein
LYVLRIGNPAFEDLFVTILFPVSLLVAYLRSVAATVPYG